MLNEKQRFYGKTKLIGLDALRSMFNSKKFEYLDIVVLFGSRATGTFHDRSDYDFAVLYKKDEDQVWGVLSKVWVDIGAATKLNEVDYDVIDLSTMTSEMKQSIKKGYKILKGSQDDISRILD